MRRPVSLLMVLGLAVAALAFLAACTSEDEEATTDSAPAAVAETVPTPKPDPTPTAVPTPSAVPPITETQKALASADRGH